MPFHVYLVPFRLDFMNIAQPLNAFFPLSDLELPSFVFMRAATTASSFIRHCHLYPCTLTPSPILWKPCSVFSSEVCRYFNPPTSHPDSLSSCSLLIYIDSCRWVHMSAGFLLQVGFYVNHHLILHCQPGCLPDGPEDGGAHRVSGWPGRSDSHRVWHYARRIHDDLFPGQTSQTTLHVNGCEFHILPHGDLSTLGPMGRYWCYPPPPSPSPFWPPLDASFICFPSVPGHNLLV